MKAPQSGYNIYFEQQIWLLKKTFRLEKIVELENIYIYFF